MRQIPSDLIQPGFRLPGGLCDRSGRVLIPAGTELTEGDLAKLGREEAKKRFLAGLAKAKTKESAVNRPELISFFPEPHIGMVTYTTLPSYYGAPEFKLSPAEEERYKCPECGYMLFRGAKRCRNCKTEVDLD